MQEKQKGFFLYHGHFRPLSKLRNLVKVQIKTTSVFQPIQYCQSNEALTEKNQVHRAPLEK